ncbi:glycine--tRNA ligase subunit beta [candidate division TA06 bacterium B3_TA06]|uniref:Glycine--tRNA ligase beta subunit n=1 Tax=candidate division TA06 bacterium B3_TA06 TaxID=2012487 RepID=A0A532V416_UNCT6|nr:MAG: glycine--tRNA ligase subunit beta [candidate division TA06 bacterium B3_TA06]
MPETRTFLLEIGTEEIPAAYLEPAVSWLAEELKKKLDAIGYPGNPYGGVKRMWTPRRLTLIVEDIPLMTLRKSYLTQGPPAKVAKDADGNWTKAAKKFAERHGVDESALSIEESEKGSYVFAKIISKEEKTYDFLADTIPSLIFKIPFPKRMRWLKYKSVTFARPIRWLCCLFGDEVVKFQFPELTPSNQTFGHRFAHPEPIAINNPEEYVQRLKNEGFVFVDQNERKQQIVAELSKAAKKLGGELVENQELIDEVTNLVECPKILACSLGGFTDLPREVLQTALAKHQRAFVVEKKGKLLPHFLVVTNSAALDPKLSKPWFERMAASRLEDADFFIKEDLNKGLGSLVEEESRVEWVKGIGTLSDKTRWLTELVTSLGTNIDGFDKETYIRAAHLAKADLLTNLVREKEFTSLQGIAGAIYTERSGEKPEVSNAIGQQYTDSPTSNESAILAISDRLLNIAATFIVGKPPKGSSDPFALRRQAGAIMKIIIDRELSVSLPAALDRTLRLIGKGEDKREAIYTFLVNRLRLFLTDQDFAYDWVDAVLAVAGDEPYDAYQRLAAFRELDKGEEFRLVAVGQKRVANITRNTRNTPLPDDSLFDQNEEKELWEKANRIRPNLESAVESRDYRKALELLLSIRPAIDRFFDEVFVMVDEEKVRTNRLHLLAAVRNEFLKVADFSRIVVEG